MPKPYSYDLRQKVIQAIKLGGMSQSQAAMAFHISRSTINLWCQRQVNTGDCQAKPNLPQGNGHKITDWEKFREFAKVKVEGACNRIVFETWLANCLIPSLQPGQLVIADNATFHKGGRIQELIEAAGCQLQYLPPYSPDLNKIERCWSWLKSRIRKQIAQFDCLRDAIESVLSAVS